MSIIKNGSQPQDDFYVKWCRSYSTQCSNSIPGGNSDTSAPDINAGLTLQAFDKNQNKKDSWIKILSITPVNHSIKVLYDENNKIWTIGLVAVNLRCKTHVNVEIGP
jgi:hypothetical protein